MKDQLFQSLIILVLFSVISAPLVGGPSARTATALPDSEPRASLARGHSMVLHEAGKPPEDYLAKLDNPRRGFSSDDMLCVTMLSALGERFGSLRCTALAK